MVKAYVCTKMDWDYNVIDIILNINGEDCWIKGFEDIEWKKAEEFADTLAEAFGIENKGDMTDD